MYLAVGSCHPGPPELPVTAWGSCHLRPPGDLAAWGHLGPVGSCHLQARATWGRAALGWPRALRPPRLLWARSVLVRPGCRAAAS
eukprot:6435846-Pyramimonas_sp.AAC.1